MTKYYPGHHFGQLRVIEIDRANNSRTKVVCVRQLENGATCGNTAHFFLSALRSGANTDCGCSKGSMIYFIKVTNYMKIGRCNSHQIESRVSLVQTNCPYDAELRRTVIGDRSTEQLFHRYFAPWHVRGEWFDYTDEMLTIDAAWLRESERWDDQLGKLDELDELNLDELDQL